MNYRFVFVLLFTLIMILPGPEQIWLTAHASSDFTVEIFRRSVKDNLITGDLYANLEPVGSCFENAQLKVAAGTYPGLIRYYSRRGLAQGDFGTYGNIGDFLLELKDTSGRRTDVLFHGGTLPQHSRGCILMGPVSKSADGTKYLDDPNHPLRVLRRKFYGSDTPNSTPNRSITIIVHDIGGTN